MKDQMKSGMWLLFAFLVQLMCILLTVHMVISGGNAVQSSDRVVVAFKVFIALILSYTIAFMLTRYILEQANSGNSAYAQDLEEVLGGKTALITVGVVGGMVGVGLGVGYIHKSLRMNQPAHNGLLVVPVLTIGAFYAGVFSANSSGRNN
jgi:glucan phosphoethanolaminetransferase (alkaline phosphatase superfamily)